MNVIEKALNYMSASVILAPFVVVGLAIFMGIPAFLAGGVAILDFKKKIESLFGIIE